MRTGIQHKCLALYLVYTSHVYPVSGPGSSGGDGPEPDKCRPCGVEVATKVEMIRLMEEIRLTS